MKNVTNIHYAQEVEALKSYILSVVTCDTIVENCDTIVENCDKTVLLFRSLSFGIVTPSMVKEWLKMGIVEVIPGNMDTDKQAA